MGRESLERVEALEEAVEQASNLWHELVLLDRTEDLEYFEPLGEALEAVRDSEPWRDS